jgi:hypothetical protein
LILEFFTRLFGSYTKATVNRSTNRVKFENAHWFTDFEYTEEMEIWLKCQEGMEVVYED